jgi:hypothetical protein
MARRELQRRMISNPNNGPYSTVKISIHLPRALSSCTHPRTRSWTSSGATSVRCHASVHLGFAGAVLTGAVGLTCFFVAVESLPRKTREKKDMSEMRLTIDFCVSENGLWGIFGVRFFSSFFPPFFASAQQISRSFK